jgi:hypothetical protein
LFGKPREDLRPATESLRRLIVTGETSKHQFFEFFPPNTIADNMIRVIALDDAYHLGVLSSRIHVLFAIRKGGRLGVGNDPRYQSECFLAFPFPEAMEGQRQTIRDLAEELDALRKRVLMEHLFLTMTDLYNVRAKLEAGAHLDKNEKIIHDAGCVGVIHRLHNEIDTTVADAYGWPADLTDEEFLARVVALNQQRAEEERKGNIRWLRPEYQVVRAKVCTTKDEQMEAHLEAPETEAPILPKDDADLVAALRTRLRAIGRPIEPKALAQQFRDGGRATRRVERGLRLLAAAGVVRRSDTGWFLPAG